jgi:hypothetical protein
LKLVFREIGANEVEKEVTQRDQFNSDEVDLVEALVREAHQNSLDALRPGNVVRTRLNFRAARPEERGLFEVLFKELPHHLKASRIDTGSLDFGAPRFLVIEDFGTTGLRGAWDRKDDQGFSDFWRRMGRSHKGGQQGGRWGLGKLVFSGASLARSFFGLTIQADDQHQQPLLMGQAVLRTHEYPTGRVVDGHGFFCRPRAGDHFQLPEIDRALIRNFAKAAGISRTNEPGLSIAIPFIRADITEERLIRELVRNYYFPILMGQLESDIAGRIINADSFDSLAREHGGPQLADGRLIGFIRDLRAALDSVSADLTIPISAFGNLERALTPEQLADLREAYSDGRLIRVRVTVALTRRKNGPLESHFDLFLKTTDGEAQALVVRGAITLPLEAAQFRARRVFGALIARDAGVTAFLGDAENPAHTKWNGNADTLSENWVNPGARLREIRSSLNVLVDLLAQAVEKIEPDALINIFSIPSSAGVPRPKPRPAPDPKVVPPLPKPHPKFRIDDRKGGFAVRPGSGLTDADLPLDIAVTAAYDLIRGNPFKKHSPLDFDLVKGGELTVAARDATVTATAVNALQISAISKDFEVTITGFDPNRDLRVRAV